MIPLGLAFGALVVQSGLDWWWAGLSAALIYGGSFEFLLIGMVTAAAPLVSIAVAAFLVNARHVFYALTSTEHSRSWSSPRILWVQLFMHLYWAGGATAGALFGALIPDSVTGLDFALTALFTVLALDAIRDLHGDVPTPVLALLSAVAARLVFPDQMLLAAFALFTTGLLARHLATGGKHRHA
ncbi:hypothetical protein SUDANB15_00254 [Streptomyces sp. enrichment culture]